MMYELKVPHALAGVRIESQQRIREKVVAGAVSSIVVLQRLAARCRGHKHQPPPLIQRHAGPIVGPIRTLPRIRRPGLIAGLARMGNGMKRPAYSPSAHIERADITGGEACTAKNDQITVHDTGSQVGNRDLPGITAQPFAKVHRTVSAKSSDRNTSSCV